MPIDLKHLESFVIATETLNFSETAKRVGTVQSAVSTHILRLEQAVGRSLFDRKQGQAMRLTAEGEAFAVYARRILTLTDEAVESIREGRQRRVISFGTTATLAASMVPRALEAFARDWPDARVEISCARSGENLRRFDAGDLDLALIVDQGKRAGRLFVENVALAWAAGPAFELPRAASIPLAFLTDGRDLRRYALTTLDRAGLSGHVAHTSPDPLGVRAIVGANLALTVMPRIAVTAPLRVISQAEGLPEIGSLPLAAYQRVGLARKEVEAFAGCLLSQIRAMA